MPTGYTARLKEMKYDVRRWLKESAVRAIGVTMVLRDDGELSEAEIKKRLKDRHSDDPYHAKKLKEAAAKLREARTWDENDWQTHFEDELAKAQRDYKKRVKEHNEGKEAHIAALNEVERIAKVKGQDEVTAGVLKFAKEQLRSGLDFDYGSEPYREKVLDQNVQQFKEATLASLEWDVKYHTDESRKKNIGNTDCHAAYVAFTKFVDSVK
jgi:hypothetical protein